MKRRTFLKSMGFAVFSLSLLDPVSGLDGSSDYPAPGRWTLNPDVLTAGERTDLQLIYENGDNSLPPGSYHRVLIEPLSIKTFFHCPPSTDLKVVPFKGRLPKVELQRKPVNGVGFREVKMIFPEGLKPGESFAVKIGNKQQDGTVKALINPIQVKNLTFEIYSSFTGDTKDRQVTSDGYVNPWNKTEYKELDWQRMGWAYYLPKVEINGSRAAGLRLFAPSLVQVNRNFDMKISVIDDFDNRAYPNYIGKVLLEDVEDIENLKEIVVFHTDDECSKKLKNLKIKKEGIYRIKARLQGSDEYFESNPIVVRKKVDKPLYWGNIHNHCQYSECWGTDLDTFYTFARDISGMDYVALSDHRAQIPEEGRGVGRLLRWRTGEADSLDAWKDTINKSRQYNKPGQFVTLYGYEWSSMDSGHYNIYVPEADIDKLDSIFTLRYTDYGFNMVKLLKDTEALFIPHGHADMLPFYALIKARNCAGKTLTPVVEVYSDWGGMYFPYEYFDQHSKFGAARNPQTESYLWAIDKGYKIGAVGDSDTHTGLPGKRTTGSTSPNHDHPQGLTAVRTDRYDRRGIMDSYHNRHVYGTTGERIFLEVKAGDAVMGDRLRTDDNFDIRVQVAGTDEIEKILLYRGLEKVAEKNPVHSRDAETVFENLHPADTEQPYAVSAIQKDGSRVFGTPIWVSRKSTARLTFTEQDGKVYLANKGGGDAGDVKVYFAENQHPFSAEPIEGRECGWNESAAMVWTERWDNRRTMFHYRWHGEPVSGEIKIIGAESYDTDVNRDFYFMNEKFEDSGKGSINFRTGKMVTVTHSQGFDILIKSSAEVPCRAVIELEKKVKTYMGPETVKSEKVTVPLNGIKDGSFETYKVGRLKSNEKVFIDSKKGYYAVDTDNKYAGKDDQFNSLYRRQ